MTHTGLEPVGMTSQSQPCADGGPARPDGEAQPSAAEWAVIKSDYPAFVAVGPISKQTSQRIYHPSRWNDRRQAFTDLSAVKFRGSEQTCRKLVERLMSSAALADQERKTAWVRHQDRIAKILAKAEGL